MLLNGNIICENNISSNKLGVWFLFDSDNNIFFDNSISNNSYKGFLIYENSDNNRFYYNNFIQNKDQGVDNGTNHWDNGEGMGNYWSDYNGSDDGANHRYINDGIGDTNIPHLELDHYPFTKPNGWLDYNITQKNGSEDNNSNNDTKESQPEEGI